MKRSFLKNMMLGTGLMLCAASFSASSASAQTKDDPTLETYGKTFGVSGNLDSIGSDTLNNLMTLWAEAFRKKYPQVKSAMDFLE